MEQRQDHKYGTLSGFDNSCNFNSGMRVREQAVVVDQHAGSCGVFRGRDAGRFGRNRTYSF